MKKRYPPMVKKAIETLLTHRAVCAPALRRAVEAHAARLGGADRDASELPENLNDYVENVALDAYRITDRDVERLERGRLFRGRDLRNYPLRRHGSRSLPYGARPCPLKGGGDASENS